MDEKQKRFHKNAQKFSQEQLLETLRRKKICNDRAQKIVEEFIEKNVDENNFLLKINFIAQTHYEDIVEERSILRICGYPLCNVELKEIPEQQYIISTVTNKVYDITEKKKYCATKCFKSSEFIKEQILTSPLWLRDDNDLIDFKLLKHEEKDVDCIVNDVFNDELSQLKI